MSSKLMCPVPLCKDYNPEFESEEALVQHLLSKHPKSVDKNGLKDLVEFAKAHPQEWFISGWREFDQREAERVRREQIEQAKMEGRRRNLQQHPSPLPLRTTAPLGAGHQYV